jgi:hypothetical protein
MARLPSHDDQATTRVGSHRSSLGAIRGHDDCEVRDFGECREAFQHGGA